MERVLIQLDGPDMERIRLLSFKTRTPFAEIIRRCVREAIETVEVELIAEAKSMGRLSRISSGDVERLTSIEEESVEQTVGASSRRAELRGEPLVSADEKAGRIAEIEKKALATPLRQLTTATGGRAELCGPPEPKVRVKPEPTKEELLARIERLEEMAKKKNS